MNSLRIYKVSIEPAASEEDAVPGASPDEVGLRTKFGGEPYWIQDDERPTCEHCHKSMAFIGQVDSFEHQRSNNPNARDALWGEQQFMFGDVGLIYIFFCHECCEPRAVFQCY
jgi:hypothetical protein